MAVITKLLFAAALWASISAVVPALAAGGGATYPNDHVPIDLGNKASLQRGAKMFVNYCMGCHSLKFQRYNRLAKDLGLSEQAVAENLMFTPDTKFGDTMQIAMSSDDGKRWFNAAPPDLSLIARSRGVDYLYNYLRGFYLDDSHPLGIGNSVKAVSMPHALWELEGWKKPIYETHEDENGTSQQVLTGFEMVTEGLMSKPEYDAAVADLVGFLSYVGEPAQMQRKSLGVWVLLFLLLAAVVFYLLKKEYWKDVH